MVKTWLKTGDIVCTDEYARRVWDYRADGAMVSEGCVKAVFPHSSESGQMVVVGVKVDGVETFVVADNNWFPLAENGCTYDRDCRCENGCEG